MKCGNSEKYRILQKTQKGKDMKSYLFSASYPTGMSGKITKPGINSGKKL